MHVTITGAGGFIGTKLVRQLLQRGTIVDSAGQARPIEKIVACDLSLTNLPADSRSSGSRRIRPILPLSRMITEKTRAVFHLAAVVSVGAEEDFELGMRVNLDTTRQPAEACRHVAKGAAFSVCQFGGGVWR